MTLKSHPHPSKLFTDTDLSDGFSGDRPSRARIYGVLLTGANLDGDITGLVVNAVEAARSSRPNWTVATRSGSPYGPPLRRACGPPWMRTRHCGRT
jgi:hypothetical protein